jgi:hypothetical protein
MARKFAQHIGADTAGLTVEMAAQTSAPRGLLRNSFRPFAGNVTTWKVFATYWRHLDGQK